VVFDHLTYSVFQPVRDSVYHWFDPGQYGVFVFFLVSGYIVPASLERRGSVRGFWGGVHRRSSRYALLFGAAAVGLGGVLVPGSLSHDLLTPGVVVAITDSLILAGLVLTLAGRGRTRIAGAVLAALAGLLLIVFNSGFAAPWETFTIFALMFTGTMLYRAEAGQYPGGAPCTCRSWCSASPWSPCNGTSLR
jgi:hypothetical protein